MGEGVREEIGWQPVINHVGLLFRAWRAGSTMPGREVRDRASGPQTSWRFGWSCSRRSRGRGEGGRPSCGAVEPIPRAAFPVEALNSGRRRFANRRISVCESSKNRPTLNQWLRLIAVGRSVGSEASAPPRRSKQDTIVIRATLRAVAQNASPPIRRLDARELLAHPVILIAQKPMLNCSRGNGLNLAPLGAYLRDGKQHMDDRIF